MRQIYLTKEELIRYLDPLDPSSRIEFDIHGSGRTTEFVDVVGCSNSNSADGVVKKKPTSFLAYMSQ